MIGNTKKFAGFQLIRVNLRFACFESKFSCSPGLLPFAITSAILDASQNTLRAKLWFPVDDLDVDIIYVYNKV